MSSKLSIFAGVFAAHAIFPASGLAAKSEDRAETLDAIQVTASRKSEGESDVPQAINVLNKAALRRPASAQTAADFLHGEPGTFVQQTTPGQGVVIVRGLKGSEVLHLVDGFRLNNAFFRNAPNQYPALVDPWMIEQIDVVRGPSSTFYGSDAMGGVVHMLSATPEFNDGGLQQSTRFRNRFSSADDSTMSRIEHQISTAKVYLRAGLSYQDVNELRIGDGIRLPFTNFTARFGNLDAAWKISPSQELRAMVQYAVQPKTPRFDELVPGFGQSAPTSAEFLFKPQERRFAQVVYGWDAGLQAFDRLVVRAGRQEIIDDRLNRDFGTLNRDTEQNSSTLQGIVVQFEKAIGNHYLTFGAEHYEDTVRSTRQRTNINTLVQVVRPARYPDGSTMDSSGIYLANDWQVTERLDINGGIRYSRFDIELPPVINNTGVLLSPDKITGNVGVAYSLTETLKLVGNVGTAFRAPNVFDLGTFGARPGNRFNIPNTELEPESLRSLDIGLKWFSDTARAELMVFKADYDDKITGVETGARTLTNQIVVQSRNATSLELWGIEAGYFQELTDQLSVFGSATLTRGTEVFDAQRYNADRIAPLFGKFGADFQVNDQFSLSAYSFYAGRQDRLSPRDRTDPRINPTGTSGWANANLAIEYSLNPQIRFRISGENLADKRYREHGTGLDEPGRNFSFSSDFRF